MTIKKYSYSQWYEKYKDKFDTSCGVHFEDGYMGSFVNMRVSTIINEINRLVKLHGDVTYIATTK